MKERENEGKRKIEREAAQPRDISREKREKNAHAQSHPNKPRTTLYETGKSTHVNPNRNYENTPQGSKVVKNEHSLKKKWKTKNGTQLFTKLRSREKIKRKETKQRSFGKPKTKRDRKHSKEKIEKRKQKRKRQERDKKESGSRKRKKSEKERTKRDGQKEKKRAESLTKKYRVFLREIPLNKQIHPAPT